MRPATAGRPKDGKSSLARNIGGAARRAGRTDRRGAKRFGCCKGYRRCRPEGTPHRVMETKDHMAVSSLRLLAFNRNAQLGRLLENCGCWPLQTIGDGFQGSRRRGKLNQFSLLFV
jgi:hypothetical protein